MRHPNEKFIQIELVSIVSAILIGIIALTMGYLILIIICFYFLALSLLAEAMTELSTHQRMQGGKQLVRAIVILILTTYLIFK